jgi:hypothetical protein
MKITVMGMVFGRYTLNASLTHEFFHAIFKRIDAATEDRLFSEGYERAFPE